MYGFVLLLSSLTLLADYGSSRQVHVLDLADYFIRLLLTILERPDRGVGYIPAGKKGVHFPTVGRALMTEINELALKTAFEAGVLPRRDTPKNIQIRFVSVQEIADELTGGLVDVSERWWGGRKAVKGSIGRDLLRWSPKRGQHAWELEFKDELDALREGRRVNTTAGCCGVAVDAP